MKKEIGGYFEIEEGNGKEYYDYLAFNSSRNSLQFIIRKRGIKKIYLPYYLCLVIRDTLNNENVEIDYYNIDRNFMPIINNYDDRSYIYIVNYFGLLSKKSISKLINKYNRKIILDNTHSFFMKGFNGIDIIYNCRKYFGVPDGSYLYTNLTNDGNYEKANSIERIKHLFGRYESNASSYYQDYLKADKSFINCNIQLMSKITHNMLKNINYLKVKKKRKENFNYINNQLGIYNKIKFDEKATNDFMYPLLLDNGQDLKKYLIMNKVFVPTLWPDLDLFPLNEFEKSIFNNLVLLPIDQRYDYDDIKYVSNLIKTYMGDLNEKN